MGDIRSSELSSYDPRAYAVYKCVLWNEFKCYKTV